MKKDKLIRIFCIIAAVLSLAAVVPIMFPVKEYVVETLYGSYVETVYGVVMYSDKDLWWYILIGVLGVVALLWNLVYCAYAIIDGRYRNLTWRIARYGYFFGIVAGIINFAVIISECTDLAPAGWAFLALLALVVAVEVVLVLLKDEDTKSRQKTVEED